MKQLIFLCFIAIFAVFPACSKKATNDANANAEVPQFEELNSATTGITFSNNLDTSIYPYMFAKVNAFDGGGVAVADFNNDGKQDIFFTGNLVKNKLYINKGNMKFEDVSAKAGIEVDGWCAGVSTADVNNDGFMDMYVCRGFYEDPKFRENILFINNGDGTFTDKAKEYGVNDNGFAVCASFFDYNRDGLLDLVVGNHNPDRTRKFELNLRDFLNPPADHGMHVYKNNGNGTFSEVSKEIGLGFFGWILSFVTADLNNDGWPDLYVAVDHDEPDALFFNNGDGTFTNKVWDGGFRHMSRSSMGSDIADLDHDGFQDIFVAEMAAMGNYNEKANMSGMNIDRFWKLNALGYHLQYMRNMLHMNNGNMTFSEMSQGAGIDRTEWSWAPLFMDANNDGEEDLFVSNGYYKNVFFKDTWKDFSHKMEEEESLAKRLKMSGEYMKKLGSLKIENQFFVNNSNLKFKEMSRTSGIGNRSTMSSGSAYADFDNDGDLDLVISNLDEPAGFYKNMSKEKGSKAHYLRIGFEPNKLMHAFGAKIVVEANGIKQTREFNTARGFISSVEPFMHFGLGNSRRADKVRVEWPDGKCQILDNVKADQVLMLKYEDAKGTDNCIPQPVRYDLFKEHTLASGVDFKHTENKFDDYKIQILLPHEMSHWGPHISKADLNKDGLEDFFVGGAAGQGGCIYLQNTNNTFSKSPQTAFDKDAKYEDIGSSFADIDKDGDLDLYVVSGGYEFGPSGDMYQDRLYLNNGKGNFTKTNSPKTTSSGGKVKFGDYDNDGDLDIFRCGRQVGSEYPRPSQSYFFKNDKGTFTDITAQTLPNNGVLGMVTDAVFNDLNEDGTLDLLVVGEWMPITYLINRAGKFADETKEMGFAESNNWWFSIEEGDFNKDGKMDFALGALGKNYKYHASKGKPVDIYGNDFDQNGNYDIVLGYVLDGMQTVPIRGRQCSSQQMPSISDKFKNYVEFAKANLVDVYGKDKLDQSIHYRVTDFQSGILMNNGKGKFTLSAMPWQAQMAPIMGIQSTDVDGDGNLDLIMAGNLLVSEVETGRADAGNGMLMLGDGKGGFKPLSVVNSGLFAWQDVRSVQLLKTKDPNAMILLIGNNNERVQVVILNKKKIPAI